MRGRPRVIMVPGLGGSEGGGGMVREGRKEGRKDVLDWGGGVGVGNQGRRAPGRERGGRASPREGSWVGGRTGWLVLLMIGRGSGEPLDYLADSFSRTPKMGQKVR